MSKALFAIVALSVLAVVVVNVLDSRDEDKFEAIVGPSQPLPPQEKAQTDTIDFRLIWSSGGPRGTSYASPRAADLNGDGILDFVTGHGVEASPLIEFPGFGIVNAFDGATGAVLWRHEPAAAEIVGSAVFVEINQQPPVDVVISGRDGMLIALEGGTGQVLWRHQPTAKFGLAGTLNFYTPFPAGDINGDGVIDLLAANGGNHRLPRRSKRPPGYLMLIDGANGSALAAAPTPDDQETYLSPVLANLQKPSVPTVLLGTGGENHLGSLWSVSLAQLQTGDISQAHELVGPTSAAKGAIAPPSLGDLTGDGMLDIVAVMYDGRIVAVDGADQQLLWKLRISRGECHVSPALGYCTNDDVPDAIVRMNLGVYPACDGSAVLVIDGATGRIVYEQFIKGIGMSSPVAVDLDHDGYDEVLLAAFEVLGRPPTSMPTSKVHLLDARRRRMTEIASFPGIVNGTPWVGDVDQDEQLDLVFVYSHGPKESPEINPFDGPFCRNCVCTIKRFGFDTAPPQTISWGAYMGTHYDGRIVSRTD